MNELECLAALLCIETWRAYLIGRKFTLVTDHKSLCGLMKDTKTRCGRQMRWVMRLSEYEYDIIHRKGSLHVVPDCMSRSPCLSTTGATVECLAASVDSKTIVLDDTFAEKLSVEQRKDKALQSISESTKTAFAADCKCMHGVHEHTCKLYHYGYEVKDGLLYRRDKLKADIGYKHRLVIPASLQTAVLEHYHGRLSSHEGAAKTIPRVASMFWWKGMTKDIRRWIMACLTCRKRKKPRPWKAGKMGTMMSTYPFQRLAIDIVGPLPVSTDGNEYILTMICPFVRWPIAVPIPVPTGPVIARAIQEHCIAIHSCPQVILADNAQYFTGTVMGDICKILGIKQSFAIPYTPSTNPHVERWHRYMNAALTIMSNKYKSDWDLKLWAILLSYRTSVHATTGVSPFFALYGREPTMPVNHMLGLHSERKAEQLHEYVQQTRMILATTRERMIREQSRASERNRKARDEGSYDVQFAKGDWCLVWDPKAAEKLPNTVKAVKKLSDKWTGPYQVVSMVGHNKNRTRFYNTDRQRIEQAHVNRLILYVPWKNGIPSVQTRERISAAERREMNTQGRGTERKLPPPQTGHLVVFPRIMDTGSPGFGVGRLTQPNGVKTWAAQWYGNMSDMLHGTFKPCWADSHSFYYAQKQTRLSDVAYTTEMSSTIIREDEMADIGFTLTKTHKIPLTTFTSTDVVLRIS